MAHGTLTFVWSEFGRRPRRRPGGHSQVTVDFRRVYASLLEQWMGTDANAVIPNARGFGRVALVA